MCHAFLNSHSKIETLTFITGWLAEIRGGTEVIGNEVVSVWIDSTGFWICTSEAGGHNFDCTVEDTAGSKQIGHYYVHRTLKAINICITVCHICINNSSDSYVETHNASNFVEVIAWNKYAAKRLFYIKSYEY